MATVIEKNETVKNKDGKELYTILMGKVGERRVRTSTTELNISEARAKEILEGA